MQNFDPSKQHDRIAMLEKVIFGHSVPDYVQPPTAEQPFPPIRQVQDTFPDGSGKVDNFNRPVMVDVLLHKPGLLDLVAGIHSKLNGTEPAAVEGDVTNASAILASLATETPAPKKRKR